MRTAEQLRRTPREWKDHQQVERERLLAEVLAELREARERRAPWYVWVEQGCSPLTPAEYASLGASSSRRVRDAALAADRGRAVGARPAPTFEQPAPVPGEQLAFA